jgi:hypothetical protein
MLIGPFSTTVKLYFGQVKIGRAEIPTIAMAASVLDSQLHYPRRELRDYARGPS